MKWRILSLTAILLSAALAPQAYAVGYVGVLGGAAGASNGLGGHTTIGLEGGVRVAPNFDLGAHFTWLNLEGAANETIVAPKLEYRFDERGNGPFLGVLTGIGITKNYLGSGTSIGFLAGPEIGYRFALPDDFSVGVNLNAAFTTNSNSLNIYSALISFAYWL